MFTQIITRLRQAAATITRGTAALGLAGLLAFGAAMSTEAEAKRVGGGQSIGRQSQSAAPSAQGPRSQQAQPAQQSAAAPAAAAGNRWMGPLAGLAAGLGIAALLSSFGLGAELAQMLSNAVLIGLVVLAAVMLFRFIAARRRPQFAYGNGTSNRQQANGSHEPDRNWQPGTAPLARTWGQTAAGQAQTTGNPYATYLASDVGREELLVSAKELFLRLQRASDLNEQGDLFELTTPEMFMRLKQDLETRGRSASMTDVTQLEAELLETVTSPEETVASIRFHGYMREDDATAAEPFQEIWHLLNSGTGDRAWQLAGIEQIGGERKH